MVFLQRISFFTGPLDWLSRYWTGFSTEIGSFKLILDLMIQKCTYKAAKGTLFVQMTLIIDFATVLPDEK